MRAFVKIRTFLFCYLSNARAFIFFTVGRPLPLLSSPLCKRDGSKREGGGGGSVSIYPPPFPSPLSRRKRCLVSFLIRIYHTILFSIKAPFCFIRAIIPLFLNWFEGQFIVIFGLAFLSEKANAWNMNVIQRKEGGSYFPYFSV